MENDLRNEQSDEAVSTSLQPVLRSVITMHNTMLEPMLDAIDAFKHMYKCQPFHIETIGVKTNIFYRDYEYPAFDANMPFYCFELASHYAQAQDRHIKNLFHRPKPTNQTPDYGC